jgi:hypothetical protein
MPAEKKTTAAKKAPVKKTRAPAKGHPNALPWVDDHLRRLSAHVITAKAIDHGEVFAFGNFLQTYAVYLRLVEGGKRAAAEKRHRDLCEWAQMHLTSELSAKWKREWDALNANFDKAIKEAKGKAAKNKLHDDWKQQSEAAQVKHRASVKRLLAKHGIPSPWH